MKKESSSLYKGEDLGSQIADGELSLCCSNHTIHFIIMKGVTNIVSINISNRDARNLGCGHQYF